MILLSVISAKAQYKINNTEPLSYGAYNTLTNAEPIIIGNDTIKAGGLRFEILKIMNDNDTGFTVNKFEPLKYGKYGAVINKNKFIIGSDTIPAQKLTATLIYLIGIETMANTNKENKFTATNYFQNIFSDTIITNSITSSTYNFLSLNTPPSSGNDKGTAGEIKICEDGIYICISTDTWKRLYFQDF